jgi:hypothetical protein
VSSGPENLSFRRAEFLEGGTGNPVKQKASILGPENVQAGAAVGRQVPQGPILRARGGDKMIDWELMEGTGNTGWTNVWRYGDKTNYHMTNLGGTFRTLDNVDGRCELEQGILSQVCPSPSSGLVYHEVPGTEGPVQERTQGGWRIEMPTRGKATEEMCSSIQEVIHVC